MTYRNAALSRVRRTPRSLVAGLLVAVAAVGGALGYQSLTSSDPTVASPVDVLRSERHAAAGRADGVVPDGETVFDDAYPAVSNLDPALLRALRRAARDAESDGIEFYVNSGWRSRAYQEQLLDEAIARYGSRDRAARWVGNPTGSAHVSGDAIDIGHSDAVVWLSEHGAEYELYQIYRNEPWHYELRRDGRPRMYPDPTYDPRMAR